MRSNILGWILSCVVLAASALALGCAVDTTAGGDEVDPALEGLPAEFNRLAEVWQLLEREHIDGGDLNAQEMSDEAIRGMLRSLDDPYAGFLTAEQYTLETQDIQGFFEGIGAEVGMRDGRITILAPMPEAPAEIAGIRPGDIIVEIDGESTQGISLMEAVAKIRGQKGTTVELLVLHLDAESPALISIIRGVIPLQSVRLLMQLGNTGHLRLFGFTENTNDELEKALDQFERSKGVGLVIDLRNNPGGLVSSVVDVASQFLDEGLVLYQVDAKGARTDWHVQDGGKARDIPMVVLVNQFSASASEVFAGAIMDHRRATVIGQATFGKGSVNNLWPLHDGSGVNFTIARWFTPNGRLLEGEGIMPDIVSENPADGSRDLQLDRAIEILQEQIARGG
jgi:carboxyl-terminal processing protease